MQGSSETLAEGLPRQINRVRAIQDNFKTLRGMPNVIVEPQIAMMERDIQAAIKASAAGDTVAMLEAYQELEGWSE